MNHSSTREILYHHLPGDRPLESPLCLEVDISTRTFFGRSAMDGERHHLVERQRAQRAGRSGRLGDRTLKRRAADVLSHFERSETSNGPTDVMHGRLEHLRSFALGFRNLTHYIARPPLEAAASDYDCLSNHQKPLESATPRSIYTTATELWERSIRRCRPGRSYDLAA